MLATTTITAAAASILQSSRVRWDSWKVCTEEAVQTAGVGSIAALKALCSAPNIVLDVALWIVANGW